MASDPDASTCPSPEAKNPVVGAGCESSHHQVSCSKVKPLPTSVWNEVDARCTDHLACALAIAPPNRYRAKTLPSSGSPAIRDFFASSTSTLNCGARYSSTRNPPLKEIFPPGASPLASI